MVLSMPIDRTFQTTWKRTSTHRNHSVWHSKTSELGIHGTRVAVDFDICTGCLKCLTVCPEEVFEQFEPSPNLLKADPVNESVCLDCLACELVCPEDAILITREPTKSDTLSALLD
jgi:NAD-dependent dihydropyrimidine dehydrogenase PreA subunit